MASDEMFERRADLSRIDYERVWSSLGKGFLMKRFDGWAPRMAGGGAAVMAGILLASGATVKAQQTKAAGDAPARADIIDELKTCQRLQNDSERLACFDSKVTSLVAASEAGDVRLVDREDVRSTRRQLFGFSLPDIGIFEGDEKDREATDTLTTTITSVRYRARRRAEFTTAEGARWEIFKIPRRLADIEPGDEVEFKKASMGTFFIRINGQMGVKGKRIE